MSEAQLLFTCGFGPWSFALGWRGVLHPTLWLPDPPSSQRQGFRMHLAAGPDTAGGDNYFADGASKCQKKMGEIQNLPTRAETIRHCVGVRNLLLHAGHSSHT